MKQNKDLLIGLFVKQWIERGWEIKTLDDYIDQKLKGLILLCDKLQEEGVETIKELEKLYQLDLKNNLLTIKGIIFLFSIKDGEKLLKVIKKYQAGKYLDSITLKPENEERLIKYFTERQISNPIKKQQWAINCEKHQEEEIKWENQKQIKQ